MNRTPGDLTMWTGFNSPQYCEQLEQRVKALELENQRLKSNPPLPHCPSCICGRRAPVQVSIKQSKGRGPGSIAWAEHLQAYSAYVARYGTEQSAERLAERGGFGYEELQLFLGHDPITWEPRR